jgi:hypothetical protein
LTVSSIDSVAEKRPLATLKGGRRLTEGLLKSASARLFKYARRRAWNSKGAIPFALSVDDVFARLREIDGKCAITGLPLDFGRPLAGHAGPFSPSIDRKIPEVGYVPNNIRIVCLAVNMALSFWGDDIFAVVADAYLRKRV